MATAWGSKGWSIGEFGTGNENVLEIPTGQSLTSSLNSVSIIAEVNNGWGAYTWGLTGWGTNTASPTVEVTGQTLIKVLESNIGISAGGSVQIPASEEVELNSSLNNVSFIIDGNVFPTTNLANLILNSVNAFPGIEVPVTAPGTPTTWGASSWGSGAWGESIGLSLFEGSATVDLITPVNVTGQLLNTSLNSVSFAIDADVLVTGEELIHALESNVGVSAGGSVQVPVFENPLITTLGTVDPAPDAEVTGQELNITFLSNDVIIDIAVTPIVTGQLLSTSLNSVTINLNTPVSVTGQSLTLSLNSVVAKADVIANVTGNSLTGTTGQLYVGAWTPVNTGQSIVWTEVAA